MGVQEARTLIKAAEATEKAANNSSFENSQLLLPHAQVTATLAVAEAVLALVIEVRELAAVIRAK